MRCLKTNTVSVCAETFGELLFHHFWDHPLLTLQCISLLITGILGPQFWSLVALLLIDLLVGIGIDVMFSNAA